MLHTETHTHTQPYYNHMTNDIFSVLSSLRNATADITWKNPIYSFNWLNRSSAKTELYDWFERNFGIDNTTKFHWPCLTFSTVQTGWFWHRQHRLACFLEYLLYLWFSTLLTIQFWWSIYRCAWFIFHTELEVSVSISLKHWVSHFHLIAQVNAHFQTL